MAISCGCKGSYNSSKHATLFLVILLFSGRACCDDHPDASKRISCLESERSALLAIKSDLYNSDHWLSSWSGYDCYNWSGVACDNTTSHVIMLDVHYPFDPYVSYPDKNSFDHAIPASIGNLTSLQVLDLSFNNLIGSIPSSMSNFNSMVVKQNYTDHLLYASVCDIKFYRCPVCHMGNSFKDNIIITAKGLTNEYTNALSAVASIDLSNNNISGEIPKEITKLHGLDFLNLSNNHLIGRIPENLGAMKELESLDLSMNYLMGEILVELSALSFLEFLNLSHNNLSGRIPTGDQLSTFNDSIYVGNEGLCGVPLPECPGDEANHSPYQVEDDDKLERVLDYAIIVMGFIVGFWTYLGVIFIKKTTRITLFQMVDNMYDWMYMHLSLKFTKLKLKWQEKSLST
ncbi:receptor-like protein EIX2 [Zingiber officinale]|uniref:receptor-like protein EIX2 n=1 Tax=Zingiber officinale TaxID=94328 RepID=UPI001C4C5988|nr:receptor-like protein EIX2 [Zingiber officinale]